MFAMTPKPQLSCSNAGSYRPRFCCRMVVSRAGRLARPPGMAGRKSFRSAFRTLPRDYNTFVASRQSGLDGQMRESGGGRGEKGESEGRKAGVDGASRLVDLKNAGERE